MAEDDKVAAAKAHERKARLARMMEQQGQQQTSNDKKQGADTQPGAFSLSGKESKQALDRKGGATKTKSRASSNAGTAAAVPAGLANLDSKLEDRRGQVSRMVAGEHPVSRSTSKVSSEKKKAAFVPMTSSARESLSGQEQDLLAKADARRDLIVNSLQEKTKTAFVPMTSSARKSLSGQEQDFLSKADARRDLICNSLQGAFNDITPDPEEEEEEQRTKVKPAPPIDDDDDYQHLEAELVDDAKERERLKKEAQAQLISQATVATEVQKADEDKGSSCVCVSIILAVLVLVGVVVGGYCGAGSCSSSGDDNDDARIQSVVDLINSVSSEPIEYPILEYYDATPAQQALLFLVENDPLKLNADDNAERIVQRFGLAVLWFANGPWATESSTSSAWLSSRNECNWEGVTCDAEGVVTELSLEEQGLSGTLPEDLRVLTTLTVLELNFNSDLTGTVGDVLDILIALAPTLTVLDLLDNRLTGTLPERISNFTSLKELNVAFNSLGGTLPKSLSSMTQLELLSVEFNRGLGGTIPTSLASLSALTDLSLSGCNFDGSLPDIFDEMTNLQVLSFGGSAQSTVSQSWTPLVGLSKLTSLHVIGTRLGDGMLPSEVADWWPDMSVISLSQTGLGGTIPSSISQWSSLASFNVPFNAFTGTFPEEAFPAWATTLRAFSTIFSTNLGGRILDNIGACTELEFFNVQSCDYTGTIPTEIGRLTNMESFALSSNRFSGTIPTEVLNLERDPRFSLDMNNFTGDAPFCLDPDVVLVSHSVDCNKVNCPCCSGCV